MKMLSGSDLRGNNIGIKIDKKMYIDAIEISSANKNNSIILIEGMRIPNKEAAIRINEAIIGILLLLRNVYHDDSLNRHITSRRLYSNLEPKIVYRMST